MEIRRISLIAPKPTVPLGASHYLVMLFWGLPLIGTILKQRGYDVRVFFEIVKPIDWDFVYSSQAVCFQTLACTANRTFEFIRRIKANNPQVVTVIGGTLPTAIPEDMLQRCDFVVRQEGDESLPDLLDALRKGAICAPCPAFPTSRRKEVVHTPNRPMVTGIDTIPDLSLVRLEEAEPVEAAAAGRMQMHVVQTRAAALRLLVLHRADDVQPPPTGAQHRTA
jgi:radical SAM superfamily enzyme YgiQ (UPF0313 family)